MRKFFVLIGLFLCLIVASASDTIVYTADSKLEENLTDDGYTSRHGMTGLRIDAFKPTIISHTFSDGKGVIKLLGDLKEIGPYAFRGCSSLTSITIPEGVTNIGYSAFEDCTNLSHINIPNSVTSIGYGVFNGCHHLPSETYIENDRITGFALYADTYLVRAYTEKKDFTIKPGTRWIGDEAFRSCSELEKIEIPVSVVGVGVNAFNGCDNLPIVDGIRYADTYLVGPVDYTQETYIIRPGTKWIGTEAFAECRNLKYIKIPNSVIGIESFAFNGTNLTSIEIPNSVERIGGAAFADCTRLKNIVLSNNLTKIEYATFMNCSSLRSIKIPESVLSIHEDAFEECYNLSKVDILDGGKFVGMDAFYSCPIKTIRFHNEKRSIHHRLRKRKIIIH